MNSLETRKHLHQKRRNINCALQYLSQIVKSSLKPLHPYVKGLFFYLGAVVRAPLLCDPAHVGLGEHFWGDDASCHSPTVWLPNASKQSLTLEISQW